MHQNRKLRSPPNFFLRDRPVFLAVAVQLWFATALVAAHPRKLTTETPGAVLLPAVAERVALKGVTLRSAQVTPLRKRVELEVQGPPETAAKALSRRSRLCPKTKVEAGKVVLLCSSGRIEARLSPASGAKFLDLSQTRGIPLGSGKENLALPAISWWKPTQVPGCGIGPQPEGSACASATEPPDLPEVWLEFGDMAAAQGDGMAALAFYRKVWGQGYWLRAARARICELTSECLNTLFEAQTFDSRAMPEPQRTDMEFRWIRTLVLANRMRDAVVTFHTRLTDSKRKPLCDGAVADHFCRELLLAGFYTPGTPSEVLLQSYLALPDRLRGYRAAELTGQAAEVAVSLGAPAFAAALMAGGTPEVPEAKLEPHLRRTAELYALAGDNLRRQVVVDFARSRFGAKQVRGASWGLPPGMRAISVTAGAAEMKPLRPDLEVQVASARELADALLAQSRARTRNKRAP